jgi:hypothetical protein
MQEMICPKTNRNLSRINAIKSMYASTQNFEGKTTLINTHVQLSGGGAGRRARRKDTQSSKKPRKAKI